MQVYKPRELVSFQAALGKLLEPLDAKIMEINKLQSELEVAERELNFLLSDKV